MAAALLVCAAFALAGRGASEPADTPPYKYTWFYRFVVELIQEDEPLTIEVIIGCGTQVRHIPGEGRSAREVWSPYIYGVRAKGGHGVLVQSPSVCGRDVTKNPVPADFLPLVLWAPDADNLEFLIAYVHERAYEQPVAKLKFVRATITDATEADYTAWRATKWKDNIVPSPPRATDQMWSFFREDRHLPPNDPRFRVRMECHSFVRIPIPEQYRDRLRARWPQDRPRYWIFDWTEGDALLGMHAREIEAEARRRGLWTTEGISLPTFYTGRGVKRPSGTGYLQTRPTDFNSGEALRVPFRTETGYPWASDRLFTQPTIDIHADTKGGADQGFAYCYRDVYSHYLRNQLTREVASRDYRTFIDDQLVGTLPNQRYSAKAKLIAERDEYLWKNLDFPLQHELGAMR
jgi:hypothetical protein